MSGSATRGRCRSVPLFQEGYTVIARTGHPRIRQSRPLDLDAYCAESHVVSAPGGRTGGIVDDALARAGRSRRVAVLAPSFLPTLDIVAQSDLIATVPSHLAQGQAAHFRLVLCDPPLALRKFPVCATWHRRASGDPAVAWIVERARQALR